VQLWRKGKAMKVLVIDDNESITELLEKLLVVKHHQCVSTNDGRSGLRLITEQHFDVILLDLAMPDFSGSDVIDHLEKLGKLKDNKVILFTASAITQGDIESLLHKGVYSCIKKPVKMSTLIQAIEA
jgi:two-component system OmpR family response regulator